MVSYTAGLMLGFLFLPLLLPALAIPYIVLRVRDLKNPISDSRLGLKIALHFFVSVCVLLALQGLTLISIDVIRHLMPVPGRQNFGLFGLPQDEDFPSSVVRSGGAMTAAGIFLGVIHWLLIRGCSGADWTIVRRTFLGFRFAVIGLVVVVTVTSLFVVLAQKDLGDAETRRTLIAILLVWAPAWVVHFSMFRVAAARTESAAAKAWEATA